MYSTFRLASSRPRRPYCSFASTTIDRPSGVSSGSDESCAASASSSLVTPAAVRNSDACRLPSVIVPVLSSSSVFTSPAASTARPLTASTLCCTRRSMPAMPIARQQPADGRRNQAHQQRDQHKRRLRRARVHRKRLQRDHRQQKDNRQPGQQDIQRNLIRRLLPLRAFHQRDHAVQKRLAGVGRNPHHNHVAQHARSAGHRRLRSPPASRITGALSPVMADSSTDATPSITSPSPGIICPATTRTLSPTRRCELGNLFHSRRSAFSLYAVVSDLARAQRVRLRLAAALRHRLAKLANSTVNHSHSVICRLNPKCRRCAHKQQHRGHHGAHLDHEHHRVLRHLRRAQLLQRVHRSRGAQSPRRTSSSSSPSLSALQSSSLPNPNNRHPERACGVEGPASALRRHNRPRRSANSLQLATVTTQSCVPPAAANAPESAPGSAPGRTSTRRRSPSRSPAAPRTACDVTGNVPTLGGAIFLVARLPATASIGTIIRNRPPSMAIPCVSRYQCVSAFSPANADPLLPTADVYAYRICDSPCGPWFDRLDSAERQPAPTPPQTPE